MKKDTTIEIKKLPNSEVEVSVTIATASFMTYWPTALKKVSEVVELDGFRKGHVPEDVIVQKFGDMIVLEEMANMALRDTYVDVIKEHKLTPVADPRVTVKKLAKDNPLEFTIVATVLPEIKLPEYKKIAKAEIASTDEVITATDEEVENVLKELQKGKTNGSVEASHDHSEHNHEHDAHDHDHAHAHAETTLELPPLDDAFAQSYGENFKTLEDLKIKVRENLNLEKRQKLSEKNRMKVMERLVAEAEVEIPEVMKEQELERMLSQMKADITRFGGTWEEYLTHMKKSEAEIKNEWKTDAAKRVTSQLVLAKIAELEKLVATEEEVEVEMVRLLAQVQDADPERAKEYLFQAISNEKVLSFLEKQVKE